MVDRDIVVEDIACCSRGACVDALRLLSSAVRRCDHVLLMPDGRIVAHGSFDDLERRHARLRTNLR